MAAFVNLTLNTKVYTPTSYTGGIAKWIHRPTSGIAAAYSSATQHVRAAASGTMHTQHKLTIPVVATADSACSCEGSVLRTAWVDIQTSTAATSTAAERLELYNQLTDFVASDAFKKAMVDNEPVFQA